MINQKWGPLEVDLFASSLSTQLPCFFSWRSDPLAEATDVFNQQWGQLKGYANPPWCLISRVPTQVKNHQAQIILSMEGPTLVPCSAGDAIRLPSMTTSLTKSIPEGVRHETDGPTTSTGHMAYLQEKFGRNNLSEPAKELLLSS